MLPNSRAKGEAPDYDPGVTGQYLKPLLEQASVKPVIVATTPKRLKPSRKVEPEEPDLCCEMTSLELEPAKAGGTPDLIRGPVVEAKPKRP